MVKRIFSRDFWTEFVMAFLICTACICILEGIPGMIFIPEQQFGYEAFFSPPLFSFFSVVFGSLLRGKRETGLAGILLRRLLHLLTIELLVFGLNYAADTSFSSDTGLSIALAFSIALVFCLVYGVLYINDRRRAHAFNQELKRYQEKILQEQGAPSS